VLDGRARQDARGEGRRGQVGPLLNSDRDISSGHARRQPAPRCVVLVSSMTYF
jgi:hypothetical protein